MFIIFGLTLNSVAATCGCLLLATLAIAAALGTSSTPALHSHTQVVPTAMVATTTEKPEPGTVTDIYSVWKRLRA